MQEPAVISPTPAVTQEREPATSLFSRVNWSVEATVASLLALFGVLAALYAQDVLEPWLLRLQEDIFFQADPLRVLEQMNTRWHNGGYTRNHPLFVMMIQPPVYIYRFLTGASRLNGALAMMSVAAGVWCVAMYAALRLARVRVFDAALLTTVGLTSAAFLFWFAVPETFPLSATAILAPFIAVPLVSVVRRRELLLTLAGLISFVLNAANWMAGLAAAFFTLPWRRAVQVSLNVLAIATLLWGVQRRVYPRLEFFMDKPPDPESVHSPSYVRAKGSMKGVLLHAAVLPPVELCNNPPVSWAPDAPKHYLSVQEARVGGVMGWTGALAWIGLLLLGTTSLNRAQRPLRYTLLATIGGLLALHTVFGGEIFLYSMHYLPVLLLLAGLATLGKHRIPALVLACVFAVAGGINNVHELKRTADYFEAPPAELRSVGHTCVY